MKNKCEKCSAENLKSKTMDVPIKIGAKTIIVQRVPVKYCIKCNDVVPTKAGQEKIQRLMNTMATLQFF